MDKLLYLCVVWALLFCNACTYREYVVRGQFPGLQDGMSVQLLNAEANSEEEQVLAVDTVRNGCFTLRGTLASPVMCRLWISNKHLVTNKKERRTLGVPFFLDNSAVEIKTPCFDSLDYISDFGPSARELVTEVRGGALQQEYMDYRRAVHEAEMSYWEHKNKIADLNFNAMFYPEKYTAEEYRRLFAEYYAAMKDAAERLKLDRIDFIRRHRASPLSLYLVEQMTGNAFAVTQEEFAELVLATAGVKDSVRMPRFMQEKERLQTLCKYAPYSDVELYTPNMERSALSAHVRPGRVTLIDCWASWCGPCRAAVPELKVLYEKYREDADFISIALNDKKDAWLQTLEEEKMPWTQLIADVKGNLQLARHYNVSTIPNLILLDKEGRVVCSTNLPEEIKIELADLLKKE